jgi:hypothetical protein
MDSICRRLAMRKPHSYIYGKVTVHVSQNMIAYRERESFDHLSLDTSSTFFYV